MGKAGKEAAQAAIARKRCSSLSPVGGHPRAYRTSELRKTGKRLVRFRPRLRSAASGTLFGRKSRCRLCVVYCSKATSSALARPYRRSRAGSPDPARWPRRRVCQGEYGGILETEVDAVSGKRVDRMGRVADQGKPRQRGLRHTHQSQRECSGRRDHFQRTQPMAAGCGDPFAQISGVQANQFGRMFLRRQPDHRDHIPRQRQPGKRANPGQNHW